MSQATVAEMRKSIEDAVALLEKCLASNTADYPKMLYHKDMSPITVQNEKEHKEKLAQGWVDDYDPATGPDFRARTGAASASSPAKFTPILMVNASGNAVKAVSPEQQKNLQAAGYSVA